MKEAIDWGLPPKRLVYRVLTIAGLVGALHTLPIIFSILAPLSRLASNTLGSSEIDATAFGLLPIVFLPPFAAAAIISFLALHRPIPKLHLCIAFLIAIAVAIAVGHVIMQAALSTGNQDEFQDITTGERDMLSLFVVCYPPSFVVFSLVAIIGLYILWTQAYAAPANRTAGERALD